LTKTSVTVVRIHNTLFTSQLTNGPKELVFVPSRPFQPSLTFAGKARGWFVEQKLMLSSICRCDQIKKRQKYDSGQTLLLKSDLDIQHTHLGGIT
jgi:hypothetical protein